MAEAILYKSWEFSLNPLAKNPAIDEHNTFECRVYCLSGHLTNELCNLKIYSSCIVLVKMNGENIKFIYFSDLVGVKKRYMKDPHSYFSCEMPCISIIQYKNVTKILKGSKRERVELLFRMEDTGLVSSQSIDEGDVDSCRDSILSALQTYLLNTYEYYDADLADEQLALFNRKLLVFINPNSGQGYAHKIYKEQVEPVFKDAGLSVDVIHTLRLGHARDVCTSYNLSTISSIVCIGGDGTIHEVINGIMARRDWEKTIKIPICPIPSGSGNAAAKTILEESSEEYSATNAAILAIQGANIPMDIAIGETEQKTIYFFLGFNWGILADCDIESDRLRFLGESRFTLAGLKLLAMNRVYPATLQYKITPHSQYCVTLSEYDQTPTPTTPNAANITTPITTTTTTTITINNNNNNNDNNNNINNDSDNCNDEDCIVSLNSEVKEKPLSGLQQQFHNNNINNNNNNNNSEAEGSWITSRNDFKIFYASFLPYITRSMTIAPDQAIGSGHFTLVLVRDKSSRRDTINAIRGFESGYPDPVVEYIKVDEFKIFPEDKKIGVFSIDGEICTVQNFHARVLKNYARIICRRMKAPTLRSAFNYF